LVGLMGQPSWVGSFFFWFFCFIFRFLISFISFSFWLQIRSNQFLKFSIIHSNNLR
jgi:hypothetical protein